MVLNEIKSLCRQFLRSKLAILITVLFIIWLYDRYVIRNQDYYYYYNKLDNIATSTVGKILDLLKTEVPEWQRKKKEQDERPSFDEEFQARKTDYGWYEGGFRHVNKFADDTSQLKGDMSSWSLRYRNIVAYSIKGRRAYMEDRFSFVMDEINGYQLFGVFDGHGGAFVADYAEEKLLQNVAAKLASEGASKLNITKLLVDETVDLDADFFRISTRNLRFTGSTALFGYLRGRDLYLANLGDCRAVGYSVSDDKIVQLTVDHKPNNTIEKSRIEKAGGSVIWNGVWRLGGILAVSRALGDLELKNPGWLIASPDVFKIDLHRQQLDLLILASDGFWDVFNSDEMFRLLKPYVYGLKDSNNNNLAAPETDNVVMQRLLKATQVLVEAAYRKGSTDNITVMIVKL